MADDNQIKIGTVVETSGLASGTSQSAALVDQMVDRMLKAFDQLSAGSEHAAEALSGIGEHLEKANDGAESAGKGFEGFADSVKEFIENPLKAVGEGAKDLLMELGPVGAGVVGMAAAIGVLGEKTYELVNEEGMAARQTQNLSTTLGLTFEETKKLSEMAKIVDVDISSLSRAAFKLSAALQDPSSKEAEELKKIGVTATETGPALLQVLEHLSQITDGTKRMAEARQILGRAAVSMAPVIQDYEKLSQAVESLGGKLEGPAVTGLLHARESVNELSIAWDHLKEAMAAKVAPIVEVIVRAATTMVTGRNAGGETTEDSQIASLKKQRDELRAGAASPYADAQTKAAQTAHAVQLQQQIEALEKQKQMHELAKDYDKGIADAYAASAERWKEANAKTLDGMKQALEAADRQIKESSSKLSGSLAPEDRAAETAALAKATADAARLKSEIKSAERAEGNASPEKKAEDAKKIGELQVQIAEDASRRKLAAGLITADQEADQLRASEAKRYGVELTAAKQLGTDLETVRLEHQKRLQDIDDKAFEEWKKKKNQEGEFNERQAEISADIAHQSNFNGPGLAAFQKMQREIAEATKKQTEEVGKVTEQAEIAHATRVYDFQKDKIQAEFDQKKITIQQKIALLKQLEQQEYETQMAAAAKGYQTAVKDSGANSPEAANAQTKIQQLADANGIAMQKLKDESDQAANAMQMNFINASTKITSTMLGGINSWITGHEKFGKAIKQTWQGIANDALQALEHIATQFILKHVIMAAAHKLFKTQEAAADAAGVAAAKAAQAATVAGNAATATSEMGVAAATAAAEAAPGGPVAAIAAGAAMVAAMSPYIAMASFDIGGVVPKTQMALVHGGERVLTESQNKSLEKGLGGEGGGTQNHYHAYPGESPDSINRNMAAFARAVRDGRRAA